MAVHQTVIFVLVIIIACNAVLYPSFFSTIFRMWFGSDPPKQEPEPAPEYPPNMRGRMPTGARRPQFPSGGGDAAAYIARQRQEGSSTSGGMMGTILPVYAVGIFIYFGYVIYKIFLKEKPSQERSSWNSPDEHDEYGPSPEREQEENLHRQLAAELRAANYDGMGGHVLRSSKSKGQASPPDDVSYESGSPRTQRSPRGGDGDEVDLLKRRLEETEKTMDKMMEMMNNMGVAFNRVTEQLNIKTEEPVAERQEEEEEEEEEELSLEDGEEESWSEGSDVIQGERIAEDGLDEEREEGVDEVMKTEEDDEEDAGTVRRRNVAATDDID